jgi:hypothetical protein
MHTNLPWKLVAVLAAFIPAAHAEPDVQQIAEHATYGVLPPELQVPLILPQVPLPPLPPLNFLNGIGGSVPTIVTPVGPVDCKLDSRGIQCLSYVCVEIPNHGSLPVSYGDSSKMTIGVGVGNVNDNDYGPYRGVFVNPYNRC